MAASDLPPPNKVSSCVPWVVRLLPYYLQPNELSLLRQLHVNLSDPNKRQQQGQMLRDAILREKCAINKMLTINKGRLKKTLKREENVKRSEKMVEGGMELTKGKLGKEERTKAPVEHGQISGRWTREAGAEGGKVSCPRGSSEQISGIGNELIVGDSQDSSAASASAAHLVPSAKRRADFLRDASAAHNRNRMLSLSSDEYQYYLNRLKFTHNLDPGLLLTKDLEIRSKFDVALSSEGGRLHERLIERKGRRKLATVEEVFDVVDRFHGQIGHGKRTAIHEAIRREFANISGHCVLLYMLGCQGCYTNCESDGQFDSRMSVKCQLPMVNGKSEGKAQEGQELVPEEQTAGQLDYSDHFLFEDNQIRCRYCLFTYFCKTRQRPKHALNAHLRNYHRRKMVSRRQQIMERVVPAGRD